MAVCVCACTRMWIVDVCACARVMPLFYSADGADFGGTLLGVYLFCRSGNVVDYWAIQTVSWLDTWVDCDNVAGGIEVFLAWVLLKVTVC